MPSSRSEFTALASFSMPTGITAIWSATTWPAARDFARDSACDLSFSLVTFPLRVTTPLSRSWLTDTFLKPAWSSDLRVLSETSGDFVLVWEQPASIPTASSKNMATDNLTAFIFLLLSSRDGLSKNDDVSACPLTWHPESYLAGADFPLVTSDQGMTTHTTW